MAFRARPAAERFWSRVKMGPGCWEWQGFLSRGYGRIHFSKTVATQAHVWSWEQANGPVPPGLVLDHLCRNRACVNPSHLEPVTHRENLLRGDTHAARNANKRNCDAGHPLSGDNLLSRADGARSCKACHRTRQAAYRATDPEKHREAVRRHRATRKETKAA